MVQPPPPPPLHGAVLRLGFPHARFSLRAADSAADKKLFLPRLPFCSAPRRGWWLAGWLAEKSTTLNNYSPIFTNKTTRKKDDGDGGRARPSKP